MRSRIWVGLIAGTIGGFLGWFFQEHLINYNGHIMQGVLPGQAVVKQGLSVEEARTLVLCVGGLIGLFLGAVDGIVDANPRKLAIGIVGGAIFGIFLGFVGLQLGMLAYNAIGGSDEISNNPGIFGFVRQVIARTFGWALMGFGLGAGSALVTRSPKRIWYGAIGGFLGGLVGGFVFDLLAMGAVPVETIAGASGPRDVGGPSRMVGFTLIGGLTGFFIGLVEELMKQAWVKVLAGRNEGKDFILYKNMNLFGRDERCDVPLFGDNAVGVQHAAIRADGQRHFLLSADTPAGTLVNGQRVLPNTELMLKDGDMIQIASHRILFHEKATASRLTRPNQDDPKLRQSGPGAVPIPSHLCAFCGAPKDAAGNCQCSIAGGSASPSLATGAAPYINPSSMSGSYAPMPLGMNNAPLNSPQMGYGNPTAMMPNYGEPAGLSAAKGQLVGLEGVYAGQVFPLLGANMEVGREPGKDIVLSADSTISRSHARLTQENGTLLVIDNNSSNGTYVNGQRLYSPVPLIPGDVVQFGATKFRYE